MEDDTQRIEIHTYETHIAAATISAIYNQRTPAALGVVRCLSSTWKID